jgi:outer membrane lipoprotein
MNAFTVLRLAALASILTLAGCVSIPTQLDGDYSDAFQPAQATERSVGARVRWGGLVIETRPERDRTCIEILAQPLDESARPERSDQDLGRFIACREQFFDPEIFVNGREVTVVGRLQGFRDGRIGEFQYRYPEIDADAIHLWPERVELPPSHFYRPWPYYRGYWPYPWGYPSPWGYWHRPGFGVHGSALIRSGEAAATQQTK